MQTAKDQGNTKQYNKLQKELTEAFTDMVTMGLSDDSRDNLGKSMTKDKEEMLQYVHKIHTKKAEKSPENSRK